MGCAWLLGVSACLALIDIASRAWHAPLGSLTQLRGLAGKGSGPDVLVMYVFSNTDPEYLENLKFFLREGVHPSDGCEYLFIVNRGLGEEVRQFELQPAGLPGGPGARVQTCCVCSTRGVWCAKQVATPSSAPATKVGQITATSVAVLRLRTIAVHIPGLQANFSVRASSHDAAAHKSDARANARLPALQAVVLPALPPNARYTYHANECFDWGTFGWGIKTQGLDLTKYKYFVFMNSSVRGPFFPAYLKARRRGHAPRCCNSFFTHARTHVCISCLSAMCATVCTSQLWLVTGGAGGAHEQTDLAHRTAPRAGPRALERRPLLEAQ
jgi:hypothetical protein